MGNWQPRCDAGHAAPGSAQLAAVDGLDVGKILTSNLQVALSQMERASPTVVTLKEC